MKAQNTNDRNQIYTPVRFSGALGSLTYLAVVDTGAMISVVPSSVAAAVGALRTGMKVSVKGVHPDIRELEVCVVGICFPELTRKRHFFPVLVSDWVEVPLIGLDVLKEFGLQIDARTGKLFSRNELWEVWKEICALLLAMWFIVSLLQEQ